MSSKTIDEIDYYPENVLDILKNAEESGLRSNNNGYTYMSNISSPAERSAINDAFNERFKSFFGRAMDDFEKGIKRPKPENDLEDGMIEEIEFDNENVFKKKASSGPEISYEEYQNNFDDNKTLSVMFSIPEAALEPEDRSMASKVLEIRSEKPLTRTKPGDDSRPGLKFDGSGRVGVSFEAESYKDGFMNKLKPDNRERYKNAERIKDMIDRQEFDSPEFREILEELRNQNKVMVRNDSMLKDDDMRNTSRMKLKR